MQWHKTILCLHGKCFYGLPIFDIPEYMVLWNQVLYTPTKLICWSPTSQYDDIWRWGTFGRQLDHEGGALINGISALIRRDTMERWSCSLPCEDTIRKQNSKRVSQELYQAAPWSWISQRPKLWDFLVYGFVVVVVATWTDRDLRLESSHQNMTAML